MKNAPLTSETAGFKEKKKIKNKQNKEIIENEKLRCYGLMVYQSLQISTICFIK